MDSIQLITFNNWELHLIPCINMEFHSISKITGISNLKFKEITVNSIPFHLYEYEYYNQDHSQSYYGEAYAAAGRLSPMEDSGGLEGDTVASTANYSSSIELY